MYGWCSSCQAIAIEGLCSKHGSTIPIADISSPDLRPLSSFEKRFFNEQLDGLTLGDGIFVLYTDRMYRRKVVSLDIPLIELQLRRDGIHPTPLAKGHFEGMDPKALIAVNQDRLDRLVEVAHSFSEYELRQSDNAVISFSGGKDSVVLADILSDLNLPKVFIDTRIEFPETYHFLDKLRADGWQIDVAKAGQSFFSLVERYGYPCAGNRWCCKTQKFEPFARYIQDKYEGQQVLVFSAERRSEGLYRMSQPLKKQHKYILSQHTIQPLLDWLSLDIWVYTWANELPVNQVYEYFDRAGCWVCPFGLEYRVFLLQFTHPKLYSALSKIGATESVLRKRSKTREAKQLCTMVFDEQRVKTCDVYGHFFLKGRCYRCGAPEPTRVPAISSAQR